MHASYLEVIERAVIADTEAAPTIGRLASLDGPLETDPEAEQIELSLLRLYRRTGAHAAAAEQYAHYAPSLRTSWVSNRHPSNRCDDR